MVSGLLLYFFIVLQSIIMSLRDKRGFKLTLPPWLRLSRNEQGETERER